MNKYLLVRGMLFSLIFFFVFMMTSIFSLDGKLTSQISFATEIAQIVITIFISVSIFLLIRYDSLLKSKRKNDSHVISTAIKAGEIIPFYQPIINEPTGELYGAEILCRWRNTNGEMIRPDIFIPKVEEAGLMADMTHSLLNQAEYDLIALRHRLPYGFYISLNISVSETLLCELTSELIRFHHNFSGRVKLVVELTEQLPTDVSDVFIEHLNILKKSGIQIALDDFGTGYSNLTWLQRIPADVIKIDKSFTSSITNSDSNISVVKDIIFMANRRKIRVVAEGVETDVQRKYLKNLNVSLQQGFYWSVPLSSREFASYLIYNT